MSEPELPPLTPTRLGLYRHYKGNMYQVLGMVRHSETLEAMTLYKKWSQAPISNAAQQRGSAPKGLSNLDSDPNFCLWVRPAAMFTQEIVFEGVLQPRFVWVADPTDPKL